MNHNPEFFATTALSDFWQKDQGILFLGAGCLRYDKREDWESLEYRVMPSPWDDRDRFYEIVRYLEEYYEKLLEQLTVYLNEVHQLSHEKRYWRILLGPWLLIYLHSTYDRYVHLKEALSQYPALQTIVLSPECYKVPDDISQFVDLMCADSYNLQLYSQILHEMGYSFPEKAFPGGWPESQINRPGNANGLRRTVKKAATTGLRLVQGSLVNILGRFRRIELFDLYLPPTLTLALAWRSGFRATPIELEEAWPFPSPDPLFDDRRNGLASLEWKDEFERILVNILPQNFPTIYLESYLSARTATLEKHSKNPAAIGSVVGWYYDDRFKFLAAESMEKGSRMVAIQHGGTYGLHRGCSAEAHETRLSDSFMVWGWADEESPTCRNLPNPKTSKALSIKPRKEKASEPWPILFVSTAEPRYLLRFDSMPSGERFDDYLDWELRFLGAIPDRVRQTIRWRTNPADYGWSIMERVMDKYSDIRFEHGLSFHQSLSRSRVVVIDNPITTYLETLAANVPTVLFWNPDQWEMRERAQPYFDGLRQAGILHDTPEEAAAKLELVYDDPQSWWRSDEIQDVRRRFVGRYALGRKDWMKSWAQSLTEQRY